MESRIVKVTHVVPAAYGEAADAMQYERSVNKCGRKETSRPSITHPIECVASMVACTSLCWHPTNFGSTDKEMGHFAIRLDRLCIYNKRTIQYGVSYDCLIVRIIGLQDHNGALHQGHVFLQKFGINARTDCPMAEQIRAHSTCPAAMQSPRTARGVLAIRLFSHESSSFVS